MTETDRSPIPPAAAIWPLFAAFTMLMLGNGLQASLVGIRTQLEGFSDLTTGLVMASYFAGFLGGSFVVPRFLTRVGHIRVFAGLASAASAAALLYILTVNPLAWGAMRLLTGVCLAGLYVVAESWINSSASNRTRGRMLAAYMVTVMGGMSLGQLLLNVADPSGFELFILSSLLISLAVVPVSLVRAPVPDFEAERPVGIVELTRRSPLGVVTGLLTGAANAAIVGMGAVYGAKVGLSTGDITLFMAAFLMGGVALQWPLGWLSDHFPRRRVIFGVALFATTIALLATAMAPTSTVLTALAFLYGGLAFPMYSLAISHVNDTTPSGSFVASAAAFLFVSGLGSIAGPLIVSGALGRAGSRGYWWSLAGFYAPVAVLALYRIIRTARGREGRFTPLPTRVSPVMGRIIEAYESELAALGVRKPDGSPTDRRSAGPSR